MQEQSLGLHRIKYRCKAMKIETPAVLICVRSNLHHVNSVCTRTPLCISKLYDSFTLKVSRWNPLRQMVEHGKQQKLKWCRSGHVSGMELLRVTSTVRCPGKLSSIRKGNEHALFEDRISQKLPDTCIFLYIQANYQRCTLNLKNLLRSQLPTVSTQWNTQSLRGSAW